MEIYDDLLLNKLPVEDLVLQVNRSAEDAALQAAPVFKKAILTMSIDDAWKILNGNDDAATQYLLDKTYADLTALYLPIMQKSLNKPLVANISAADTWGNVTSKWNKFANSIPGKIMEAQAVNNELDVYVTDKALKGVFLKVGEQEKETIQSADEVLADLFEFKGFEYNVGDKKYRVNVKEAGKVKDTQSDINNFVKKFLNEDGTMSDAKGYHKALYSAMNSDAIAQHFYEQGKADALKQSVAKSKNVDMTPGQNHKEFESGGIKVRVLGDNSSDFKFKINKRK